MPGIFLHTGWKWSIFPSHILRATLSSVLKASGLSNVKVYAEPFWHTPWWHCVSELRNGCIWRNKKRICSQLRKRVKKLSKSLWIKGCYHEQLTNSPPLRYKNWRHSVTWQRQRKNHCSSNWRNRPERNPVLLLGNCFISFSQYWWFSCKNRQISSSGFIRDQRWRLLGWQSSGWWSYSLRWHGGHSSHPVQNKYLWRAHWDHTTVHSQACSAAQMFTDRLCDWSVSRDEHKKIQNGHEELLEVHNRCKFMDEIRRHQHNGKSFCQLEQTKRHWQSSSMLHGEMVILPLWARTWAYTLLMEKSVTVWL